MKKKKPNKIIDFFAEKGFYIILILCIAAIGISGYVLFFSNDNDDNDMLSIGDNNPGDITDTDFSPAPTPYETELQTDIPDYAERDTEVVMADTGDEDLTADDESYADFDEDDEELSESVMAEVGDFDDESESDDELASSISTTDYDTTPVTASFFVWPVNGEIIERFSVDELVFSATLGDWRVHTGIDIAAGLGTQVCAMGDGVVEDVYTDELMGVTVVIDHGNSVRSVYRNLMESVAVEVGDTVYAGDVIGGVGQTADNEILDPPHLHLEVIKNGAQVDPCDLLP
ncbi:MAG: peptidoglycan DD-metalloendopeptidase family protein [Eubacteriales bacterium]|jgi:murein DD-endopeptidase MepM/ murein hydrolase activator NlpD